MEKIKPLNNKFQRQDTGSLKEKNISPPQPGLYHFLDEDEFSKTRIHLRLDPDMHGTMIVNANQVTHLNPTAAVMAYYWLNNRNEKDITRAINRQFAVSRKQIKADYQKFLREFEQLVHPDQCAVCNLDQLEISAPFSARPTAPYRMDLAITYRCNDDCAHCYNARPRNFPEESTEFWKQVIDKTWSLAIPHIVFTGGEPTLRNDLPDLIKHAESNGQITGLNTNARRLSDSKFVQSLVDAGLDHIQITVESHDEKIHDQMVRKKGAWAQTIQGLKNVLETELYVMTNTTMLRNNQDSIDKTIDFLADLGVPTIGLNALIYSGYGLTVGTGLREDELPPILNMAKAKTLLNGQKLIWYTPTQYCHFDPTQYDLGVKGCTAALYNMCIEPDGAVLPCQSYYHSLGNFLEDSWKSIWNHDLSVSLRDRNYVPVECKTCALLTECGGGCPLSLESNQPELIPLDTIPVGEFHL